MNKTKKLLIMIGILLFTIAAVASIFIGAHTIKTADHSEQRKLVGHGGTTSSRSRSGQDLPDFVKSSSFIRISSKKTAEFVSEDVLNKIESVNGVSGVYTIMTAQSRYGEVIGINPKKGVMLRSGDQFVGLQPMEGRLLTEEDIGTNTMIVNGSFAKSQKTTDGYQILGRLGYHPKSFMLEDEEMSIAGIFAGISDDRNTIVMPLSTLLKLGDNQVEIQQIDLFVFIEEQGNPDNILLTIKNGVLKTQNFSTEIVKINE